MPLVISDHVTHSISSLEQFLLEHPHFKEGSESLRHQAVRDVGPQGLLYINQRELAVTTPEDAVVKIMGTDDATTCHIAVLRHTGSGAVSLAHLDGCNTEQCLNDMVRLVKEHSVGKPEGRLELHLVGGFCDDRKLSAELSISILRTVSSMDEQVHLITACITDHNDVIKDGDHYPVIYGLAVNVETGEIFPARFANRGPEIDIRSARNFTGGQEVLNIYNARTNKLIIGPFTFHPLQNLNVWMQLPDHVVLQNLSTSPKQEPPTFIQHVREVFSAMKAHPRPKKSLFPKGKGHVYRQEASGTWVRVK